MTDEIYHEEVVLKNVVKLKGILCDEKVFLGPKRSVDCGQKLITLNWIGIFYLIFHIDLRYLQCQRHLSFSIQALDPLLASWNIPRIPV